MLQEPVLSDTSVVWALNASLSADVRSVYLLSFLVQKWKIETCIKEKKKKDSFNNEASVDSQTMGHSD